jgi:HK97 family phage portal protein
MGILADTIKALVPSRGQSIGAVVPTWEQNRPQTPRESYQRYAFEGYSRNELIFAAVEELATSAAEPRFAAYLNATPDPKRVEQHEVLDLLAHPNPYLDRYALIAGVIMHRSVAGNAYLEMVRSRAGKVVELWPLRPDRMFVIPGSTPDRYIDGYEYRLANQVYRLRAEDVIHIKTRNPLDDYYGLPPLAVVAQRVDLDAWIREFAAAFFRNSGVPAGLLQINRKLEFSERQMVQQRFRTDYGGPGGWHRLMILDGPTAELSYTPMTMPLGERGLVLPELTEINEARVVAPFGVPLQLIGTRLGMQTKYSNWKEARESFWQETLSPLYAEIAAKLTAGLASEFDGFDYLEFDLSKVQALAEDEDAKHTRVREDLKTGIITREEAREALGYPKEPDNSDTWVLPANVVPEPVNQPEPAAPPNVAGALPEPDMPAARNGTAALSNGRH